MSSWQILEWSRETGQGAISSPLYDCVSFDASATDVDDLSVGETVSVEFDFTEGPRVVRLTPHRPRFPRMPGRPPAAPLDEGLRVLSEQRLAVAHGWKHARVRCLHDRVRLEFDNQAFRLGVSASVDLLAPQYVEVALQVSPKFVCLADRAARAYLATRVDLTSKDVAVAIINQDNRFFFIVAAGVAPVAIR